MIQKRIVVFSGFDTRVIEKGRKQIEAAQAELVLTRRPETLNDEYFNSLLLKLHRKVADTLSDGGQIVAVLASCLQETADVQRESATFMPILRRLSFEKTFRADLDRSGEVSTRIVQVLTSSEYLQAHSSVRASSAPVLSLPVENAGCRRLRTELERLYRLEQYTYTAGLTRFVQRLRRGGGLRSGALIFKGCTNGPDHPIRKRSDSLKCELEGQLRLGFSLPARFEFDVTTEGKLGGRSFTLCSGTRETVAGSPSHLNMRINGDFEAA